ncbi:MAG: trypsin-like peptidase domain-containing protein, partial [Fimbriimonadaceae bacterium]|nr:trypsin-like peptidase domain-containing protein [Alphaproteobacteria bacterium]
MGALQQYFVRSLMLVFAILLLSPIPARANYEHSETWFNRKTFEDRTFVQLQLVLTGHYNGFVDGVFGQNTYKAIRDFERSINSRANGVLTNAEEKRLLDNAAYAYGVLGFEDIVDRKTGLLLPVPLKLAPNQSTTKRGIRWTSNDGYFEMETLSIPETDIGYFDLYSKLIAETTVRSVTYSTLKQNFFVVSGIDRGKIFYLKIERFKGRSAGFSMTWTENISPTASRTAIYVASLIRNDLSSNRTPRQSAPPAGQPPSANNRSISSSGSGFFISAKGHIITNNHVIDNCRDIEVAGYGTAVVIRADSVSDLSVLRLSNTDGFRITPAILNITPVQLGQNIISSGFPLGDVFNNTLV